jgi:hypothetical protein
MCDISINVLLQTSALVGPLYITNKEVQGRINDACIIETSRFVPGCLNSLLYN